MKKNTVKVDIIIIAVILLLIAGGVLLALLPRNEQQIENTVSADTDGDGSITYKDYIGKRIGIKNGSSFEDIAFDLLPDSEYMYFDSTSDLAAALQKNKIDAFLEDEPVVRMMCAENSDLDYIRKPLKNEDYSFMFKKGSEKSDVLLQQFNELLSELKDSGRLEELADKWFGDDDSVKTFDRTPSSVENGAITVAGLLDNIPFAYYLNNEYTGYAVELITIFGQRYGYSLEFEQPNITAMLAGIGSGRYDVAIGSVSVTEERAETANFSDPIYTGGVMIMVRASDISQPDGASGTKLVSAVTGEVTLSDFNGKTAGVITGSMHDALIKEKMPDSQRLEYKNYSDLTEALTANKIDYFLMSRDGLSGLMAENDKVGYIDEPLDRLDVGAIFAKSAGGMKIREQFNEFIEKIRTDGTLGSIYEYWRSSESDGKSVDMSGLTGENGTLVFATTGDKPPVTYVASGNIAGTDPDIAVRFCREYGYDIKVEIVDGGGFVPGVVSGIYDFAMADFVITEERKESVDFSIPYSQIELFVTARKEDTGNADNKTSGNNSGMPMIRSISELNDPKYKVGVGLGTSGFFTAKDVIPNAQIIIVNDHFSAYEAVSKGIYDAYIYDRLQMQLAIDNGINGVTLLDENFGDDVEIAVGLSRATRIPNLTKKINQFIAEVNADGTNDDAIRRWVSEGDYVMPEIKPADDPIFTLRVGTCGIVEPYSFYERSVLTGYDIEMAKRFAAWLGADIEFKVYDYSGLYAAIASGDVDCIFADLMVTDEGKEVMDYSDPLFIMHDAVMVALENGTVSEDVSFIQSIINSFEKNFIREDRWKMIVEGIGTTCLITVLSVLFGSLLAFSVCMFRRTGSRLANAIADIYVRLLQGTPIVVLLMILYYVVLGKSGLEAVWVAIIGFTLNFGAYTSEIMQSGIESIDGGQREAALALGYSENQTFFRFVFPQAAVRFVPVYKQEIISLLKSTSIVGYIAIQDLTKMSDIIRSRTYEAFFPLIATAIIYFILAWVIALILKLVIKAFDRRRRERIDTKKSHKILI